MGLPVLRQISSFTHAVATTPADHPNASLVPFRWRRPSPNLRQVGSALPFSRPAQRSLTLQPACLPSRLCDPLHRRLRWFRYLHHRSDCYRLKRQLPDGFRTHWRFAPFSRRT